VHTYSELPRVAVSVALVLTGFVIPAGQRAVRAEAAAVVTGVAVFDGPRPSPRRVQLREKGGKQSDCHRLHKAGLFDENLIVGRKGELANVFVYVKKGYKKKRHPAPERPAVLNQQGCMFRPRVQGVMVGQDFVMKNGDPLLHNVRALSFRNRPFNVAQPANSPDRKKVFTRREKAIMIQCDLHPWMKAWYFVMDHPWFAVTDRKGRFRINGLPAGKYTLAAWHEELDEQTMEVTVKATGSPRVKFSFKPRKSNVIIAKATTVRPSRGKATPTNPRPQRPFVRKWTIKELTADAADLTGRSFERGRKAFNDAGCIKCHVVAGKGAKFGPELSDVSRRLKGPKLLEQILKPSAEIHKDFYTHVFAMDDGTVISGLVIKDKSGVIHVLPNPLRPEEVKVLRKSNIEVHRKSKVSIMPEGLLDTFKRDELLDLLLFVQSGGRARE